MKLPIHSPDLVPVLQPYPVAVKHDGLVFLSGVRPGTTKARKFGFDDLPASCQTRKQGFGLPDRVEGEVSADSWSVHTALDAVLAAAGTRDNQILRQHVWQRDKRFFPCYERVRAVFQPKPSPSSGLGVAEVVGGARDWIGIDAIAVVPGENPARPERQVTSEVYDPRLPSASHYSQSVTSGDLLFTAGHIPIKTTEPGKPLVQGFDDVPEEGRFLATGRSHPDSRDGPIAAQTWFVYAELRKLLATSGMTMDDVVLSTVYLADPRDFPVFHRMHQHFFPNQTAALAVTGFDEVGHRGCRIEIELTAAKDAASRRELVSWGSGTPPFAAPAAVRIGSLIFYSGMVGLNPEGSLVTGAADVPPEGRALVARLEEIESRPGFAAQTWASFARLSEAAKRAGSDLKDLLKMTVYLRSASDLPVFEAVRRHFIADADLPAFECVAILGPGPVREAEIQIEAIGAA
ncbi:MAG: Rid family hydrolase [Beijerinckiaceae bacterium]|nr:Rid family hydrolase [Beijerinckiaceae bacterium]